MTHPLITNSEGEYAPFKEITRRMAHILMQQGIISKQAAKQALLNGTLYEGTRGVGVKHLRCLLIWTGLDPRRPPVAMDFPKELRGKGFANCSR